jgi:Xaa-Pro aminopeptidase
MDHISLQELQSRWDRCRKLLKEHLPAAEGLIVFSRLNIYYFTGTFGNGVFWLPLQGEPVLLCRRGCDRASIESVVNRIVPFNSYKDVEGALRDAGAPIGKTVAVEMNGLSWMLGNSFSKHLPGLAFPSGDKVISMTRSQKTAWELERLRIAGAKHKTSMVDLLPQLLKKGMSEFQMAHTISHLFFSQGHQGILRMENYGEEIYQGYISIGESGNYPSVFNIALGVRGVHPAIPHMGSRQVLWEEGMPVCIDTGFMHEGYQTDKTQIYWLGESSTIPTQVQAAFDCCVDIQTQTAEQLKPGIRPSDLWAQSLEYAKKKGFEDGYMGLGRNKVPFLGHGIGLAIDEYPVIAKGFDLPLEEGCVLAVEPKIGIPGVGMVGVENTFEVTTRGGKCLTGENYEIICVAP